LLILFKPIFKNAGLFWVKFGQTQPLGYIFNPLFEFVHILSKIGLKQPSIFL